MTSAGHEDKEIRAFYGKHFWAFSDSVVVLLEVGSEAEQLMSSFDARLDQLTDVARAQGLLIQERQLVRVALPRAGCMSVATW